MAAAETFSLPAARPGSGQYRPASFLERGVALPFTTPALLGGRARPGGRGVPELVLANPALEGSVYVLHWAAVRDICAPTLHDRALWDRVARLPAVSPRAVREAAWAVAGQGLAGRAAARAAVAAEQATREAAAALRDRLLPMLAGSGAARPAGTDGQAAAAPARHRPGDGTDLPAAAEALAALLVPCGVPDGPAGARLPGLASEMVAMAEALVRYAESARPPERPGIRLLAEAVMLMQRCFRVTRQGTQALLQDPETLLRRWRTEPDSVAAVAARPDWLLDGWDVICALWRVMGEGQRGAALAGMAALVPPLPAELAGWVGFDAPGAMETLVTKLRRWHEAMRPDLDGMSRCLPELTARNESLRVRCA